MATGYIVRRNESHDPAFLAQVEKHLSGQRGVRRVAALMATQENKVLLADFGVTGTDISAATPGDLVIAVEADSRQSVAAALGNIDSIYGYLRGQLASDSDEAGSVLPG